MIVQNDENTNSKIDRLTPEEITDTLDKVTKDNEKSELAVEETKVEEPPKVDIEAVQTEVKSEASSELAVEETKVEEPPKVDIEAVQTEVKSEASSELAVEETKVEEPPNWLIFF